MRSQDDTAVAPNVVEQLRVPPCIHALQADADECMTADETGWFDRCPALGVPLDDASSQQSLIDSAPHRVLDTEYVYRACAVWLSQHSYTSGQWLRPDLSQYCRRWRVAQ